MILLFFWLEFGIDSQNFLNYMENGLSFYEQNFYLTFDTKLVFGKIFFIEGQAKVNMKKFKNIIEFFPEQLVSVFGIGLQFKNITIGYRHLCSHPVKPYNNIYNSIPKYEGAIDQVYIRIRGKGIWD